PRERFTGPRCGRCTRSALADRTGAHRRGGSFSSGRRLILRLPALSEGRGGSRQPFFKFITAGPSHPTLLPVAITLDRSPTPGGLRAVLDNSLHSSARRRHSRISSLRFWSMARLPRITGGSATGLSAIGACAMVVFWP